MRFIVDKNLRFITSCDDYKGVLRIANTVKEDISSVCGKLHDVMFTDGLDENSPINAVIFGTAGKSSVIDGLEKSGVISLDEIKNKREVYKISLVSSPLKGVSRAIVIAGSDKRGTIYGLFKLSEKCGVSPLYKWSGCVSAKRDEIVFDESIETVSKEPSVKYRGIFINDEWPAFGNWATTHFGGVNAKCYEQVFEMILRLKGNYLWPAMWATNFSLEGPGLASAELADEMGIVMSTSHHEPCMRAGAEYGKMRGKGSPYGDAWDFISNREGITRFWEDGLIRNAPFENVITMGMRGENDTAIMANATLEDNIALLRDVLHTQNELIKKTVNPDLSKVERQIVLFTEVEKFYYGDENTKGLIGDPETDGVCIMLSDSNFGYTRTLPTEKMREHKGGYGMYYHIDMHGGAHAYEWVGTSLLPRMWEQMSMAYDHGVKDIWVVNVGDIGTQELAISYFLNLAYDFDKFGTLNPNNTNDYIDAWVKAQFGGVLDEGDLLDTASVLKTYSQICERRKHEVMNDKVYHPVHFGEADSLIADCEAIISICDRIKNKHPEELLTGFWELVYYPCVGTANLMKTWCYASKNRFYADQNRNESNLFADMVKQGIEFDRKLTDDFHKVADGKFYGFGLSEHFGFVTWCEEGNKYPLRIYTEPANKPRVIVAKSDDVRFNIGKQWTGNRMSFDDFLRPDVESVTLEIACGSRDEIEYKIACDKPWLCFSKTEGKTLYTDRINVKIDRTKLKGKDSATVTVSGSDKSRTVITFNADNPSFEGYKPNTFIEYDGYVAIEAEHYLKKHDTDGAAFTLLKPYGKTGSAMKVYPTLADFNGRTDMPALEYLFEAKGEGTYNLELYFAPSTPTTHEQEMLAGISLNGGEMFVFNTVDSPNEPYFLSRQWSREAFNNVKVYKCKVECKKGVNLMKYCHISPNLALERIVLFKEGTRLPESYLGPKESFFVKAENN